MNGGTRQRNLLIVLGVLLLIVGWMYLGPLLGLGGDDEAMAPVATERRSSIDDEGGPSTARSRDRSETKGARPGDRVAVLRMADLDRAPRPLKIGRDPWRFVDPPPPPAPPPAPPPPPLSAEELRRIEEARRRAEEAARLAAIEAAKPRPAEFTMEYLGYFGPPDRKVAVFSNGKTTRNALEGQVLDNKFIVARIGYESVDIGFVGFPDWPVKRLGVRRK
ncbi:MAG TPA: hypothetical protein VKK31_25545 [Thermoanaerobaculia bacterium]|nr:hypothetical protein [Thermoanaerobaculia bacterium]